MRQSGGPFDQPGGCSFKTYVRAQKLRDRAELCLWFEWSSGEQAIGNKSVTRKRVGRKPFQEFFTVGENATNLSDSSAFSRGVSEFPVLDLLIQPCSGFRGNFFEVEAGK